MSLHTIPAALLLPQPITEAQAQRDTPEWQRLRAAVGDGHAPYIDPDRHTDDVWRTLYGPEGIAR